MTLNHDQAKDEMFAAFNAAWSAGSAAIVGYVPEVRWPGKEEDKPDGSKFWARVSEQVVDEPQTSLSACLGESQNAMRTTCYGLLFVQIFAPKSVDDGYDKGDKLAQLGKTAFRGKKTSGGVWFRNARATSLPAEDLWNRFNVVTEYEYDEVS